MCDNQLFPFMKTTYRDEIYKHLEQTYHSSDDSHGLSHFKRVAENCLLDDESDHNITIPAALLHDCYHIEKSSPLRRFASKISAATALIILNDIGYDCKYFDAIYHCIEAHSFSANIKPQSKEAQVVQDADRLDALGYIGIFRCFYTGGRMNRLVAHPTDPKAINRELNDNLYSLDHFYVKLFNLAENISTPAFAILANVRTKIMQEFIANWEDMQPLCQIISDGGKYHHDIATIKNNLQACHCDNIRMKQELIAAIA